MAFSGDNPSAMIGMGANHTNDIVISLGTSDTVFANLGTNLPSESMDAHIFCSALDKQSYMALCCYKNGSLVRQKVLEDYKMVNNEESWDRVSQILSGDEVDKAAEVGLFTIHFLHEEIGLASSVGSNFKRTYKSGELIDLTELTFEEEIIALITGQFIAKKAHVKKYLGVNKVDKILITGGASCNKGLLQLIANIFQADV